MYYCGPRPRKEHCMLAWSYVLPDICRPIPRRIESFGKIGKTRVFPYKPTICWKNPGFSPKSRVNLGFAFEPEKFLGFRRLGYMYVYITTTNFQFIYQKIRYYYSKSGQTPGGSSSLLTFHLIFGPAAAFFGKAGCNSGHLQRRKVDRLMHL